VTATGVVVLADSYWSEAEDVLTRVGPKDPGREVALIAEGFCPWCGVGLELNHEGHGFTGRDGGGRYDTDPFAWCTCCLVGWRAHGHEAEAAGLSPAGRWVRVSTVHRDGRPLGSYGWLEPSPRTGVPA
jgi:hypothetical protein